MVKVERVPPKIKNMATSPFLFSIGLKVQPEEFSKRKGESHLNWEDDVTVFL